MKTLLLTLACALIAQCRSLESEVIARAAQKQISKLMAASDGVAGWGALHQAAFAGDTDTVNQLAEHGADLEAKDQKSEFTMLPPGDMKTTILRKILKDYPYNQRDPDPGQDGGKTAVHLAARNGRTETVKRLMELGAELEARDNRGQTPLFVAARNGQTDTVAALHKLGADLQAQSNDGRRPSEILGIHAGSQFSELLAIADISWKTEMNLMQLVMDLDAKEKVLGSSLLHKVAFFGKVA